MPGWGIKIPYAAQFSSVAQWCRTLCDPMSRGTPGLPVHHQLPGFTQTHVHRVSDAIQPSHPLSSPSPPAPNPSQHQSLFQRCCTVQQKKKKKERKKEKIKENFYNLNQNANNLNVLLHSLYIVYNYDIMICPLKKKSQPKSW